MVDEANAAIETLPPPRRSRLMASPASPSSTSAIRAAVARRHHTGAINVTRGMLECGSIPEPYAKDYFQSGNKLVFFCAGAWSALALGAGHGADVAAISRADRCLEEDRRAGRRSSEEIGSRHGPDSVPVPQPTLTV
jgi:hypothetical protein